MRHIASARNRSKSPTPNVSSKSMSSPVWLLSSPLTRTLMSVDRKNPPSATTNLESSGLVLASSACAPAMPATQSSAALIMFMRIPETPETRAGSVSRMRREIDSPWVQTGSGREQPHAIRPVRGARRGPALRLFQDHDDASRGNDILVAVVGTARRQAHHGRVAVEPCTEFGHEVREVLERVRF